MEDSVMKMSIPAISAALFLLLFAFVPAYGQEATSSEIEPNDEPDLSDYISGYTINGDLGYDGDMDDWFTLEGQEGNYTTYTMDFDPDQLTLDWEIYDGDTMIASSLDLDISSTENLYCVTSGEVSIHVWVWEGEGRYVVTISPVE
jgi:hypothetical protein